MENQYDQEILDQLKKLNAKLDKMTHPVKSAWSNFLSGIFRSLGYIFGTAVVAALIIYFVSQSKIGQNITNWIQSYQPSNYQISVPSLDQP